MACSSCRLALGWSVVPVVWCHPLSLFPLCWFKSFSWSLHLLVSSTLVMLLWAVLYTHYCPWDIFEDQLNLRLVFSTFVAWLVWTYIYLVVNALFQCWWLHVLHWLFILTYFVVWYQLMRFFIFIIYREILFLLGFYSKLVLAGVVQPGSLDLLILRFMRCQRRAPFLLAILEASDMFSVFT